MKGESSSDRREGNGLELPTAQEARVKKVSPGWARVRCPLWRVNFWTLMRQHWTGKTLFTSGCISQSSMGMHLGVYIEPLWSLANTEHTGP